MAPSFSPGGLPSIGSYGPRLPASSGHGVGIRAATEHSSRAQPVASQQESATVPSSAACSNPVAQISPAEVINTISGDTNNTKSAEQAGVVGSLASSCVLRGPATTAPPPESSAVCSDTGAESDGSGPACRTGGFTLPSAPTAGGGEARELASEPEAEADADADPDGGSDNEASTTDTTASTTTVSAPETEPATPTTPPRAPNTAPLLPPPKDPSKMTLVLDLDGTLIASDDEPHAPIPFDYCVDEERFVWLRPGLRRFLDAVRPQFEVVLFTAAGESWATCALQRIDPDGTIFDARLYRDHTVSHGDWPWVKDLSRLGRDLARVVIVDDNPLMFMYQPDNALHVGAYDPQVTGHNDDVLEQVLDVLTHKVLLANDVRDVLRELKDPISASCVAARQAAARANHLGHTPGRRHATAMEAAIMAARAAMGRANIPGSAGAVRTSNRALFGGQLNALLPGDLANAGGRRARRAARHQLYQQVQGQPQPPAHQHPHPHQAPPHASQLAAARGGPQAASAPPQHHHYHHHQPPPPATARPHAASHPQQRPESGAAGGPQHPGDQPPRRSRRSRRRGGAAHAAADASAAAAASAASAPPPGDAAALAAGATGPPQLTAAGAPRARSQKQGSRRNGWTQPATSSLQQPEHQLALKLKLLQLQREQEDDSDNEAEDGPERASAASAGIAVGGVQAAGAVLPARPRGSTSTGFVPPVAAGAAAVGAAASVGGAALSPVMAVSAAAGPEAGAAEASAEASGAAVEAGQAPAGARRRPRGRRGRRRRQPGAAAEDGSAEAGDNGL
ncbi:hypothetical protein HYH03_008430 [Edaphochlamys debaryana]|uniref:FCP1 homology domain-containing protein n=1 Tax=Edaphochlamys debaryana TaxID=47281 RepID=A0A835Y946_9CHLO|nr:hypothetical protein HYH03_008430 [Edaphochlamys debaryana]|eukprot:KAG2493294.1 hypothetical protein HYH03_008430 [Edaphochlamys debaryana]